MTSRSQNVTSQHTSTTPHRLRSGTHYGNHAYEPANNSKKDCRKNAKDCQVPDPDMCKGERDKAGDSELLNDVKIHCRRASEKIVTATLPSVSTSPNGSRKGQNLKGILESIEPNLSVKDKSSSRRKILRDLLDQEIFKDKQDPELQTQKMDKSVRTEKCVANKENNHHVKSVQDKEVSTELIPELKRSQGVSPNQSTTHTQTKLQVCDYAKLKPEPTDDYWAMKMNYVEKRSVRNNAVELRIKAETHSGQDDHSQTFRISCSRPDTANNNSSALHRNIKPDIVLKVRPRSSSQPSTINRSTALDVSSRPASSYKAVSRFHGRLEPQTTIFSTVKPLNLKHRSSVHVGEEMPESKVLHARSIMLKQTPTATSLHYQCSTPNLHALGVILQGDNTVHNPQGHVMLSNKSLTLDMVSHSDVLEESKLPPVANTVELLSEPHEYKDSSVDTGCIYKVSDYALSAASCTTSTAHRCSIGQHVADYGHRSLPPSRPELPVMEHVPALVKPESRYEEADSTTADWSLESSLCLKRDDPMLWRDFDLEQDNQHGMLRRYKNYDDNDDDDDDNAMLGACSLPNLVKEESDDDDDDRGRLEEIERALEASESSRGRERRGFCTPPKHCRSGRYRQSLRRSTPVASSRASTPVHASNTSTPRSSGSSTTFTHHSLKEEAGSRRRRKGRPSRHSDRQPDQRWQTPSFSFSPANDDDDEEEDDEEDDDEEEENARSKGRGSLSRSSSTSSSASSFQGRRTKGSGKRPGESGTDGGGSGRGRGGRRAMDPETLWANPELDTHGFLLWASEKRGEVEKRNKDVSAAEVEGLLASQWRQMTFSGKLQYLCRARDASTDHNKHTLRKKKVPKTRKTINNHRPHSNHHHNHHYQHHNNHHHHQSQQQLSVDDGRCVYEQFLRLPQERQKDLLRKWLRFFQKMLPRLEYQDFISDFKKACKTLQLRPVPARRKNARLRNLDPSHYHMLFEKIRETRPRVISVYNKRKTREEELLRQSFSVMVKRLINGQHWPFVRGCRSKVLGELMKDIQQLEVEEVLAQIDLPMPLIPGDLGDPFLAKDGQDNGSVLEDPAADDTSAESEQSQGGATGKDAPTVTKKPASTNTTYSMGSNNSNSMTGSSSNTVQGMLAAGPAGDTDLPDTPYVLGVLESLRHSNELPLLDQRCLDAVFLGPPSRSSTSSNPSSSSSSASSSSASSSRGQTVRETQFQNSATYRRTLLYKHIQPLLDTRGMPLTSTALYHSHSAQFFYSDDR